MTEREYFKCEESGEKFQFPNGAVCAKCKRMVATKYYIYVDLEPVCLKCRKKEISEVMESLKRSLN